MTSLNPRNNALKLRGEGPRTSVAVAVLHCQAATSTTKKNLLMFRRQVLPRDRKIDVVGFSHRFEHPSEVLSVSRSPWSNRSIEHRDLDIGDHKFGINLEGGPKPITGLTRAIRRVKREVSRRRFIEARTAGRAGKVLAKRQRLAFFTITRNNVNLSDTVGELQGSL